MSRRQFVTTLLLAVSALLVACVARYVQSVVTKTSFIPAGFVEWNEIVGFVTGVVGVYLAVVENMWNWPIGIANVIAYAIFLYYSLHDIANAGLQVIFLVYQVEGWLRWKFGGADRSPLSVGRMTRWQGVLAVGTILALTAIVVPTVRYYNGNVPFWDGLTFSLSVGAQVLLNRKRIENWWIWIVADAIYVPLYAYQKAYVCAVLYLIFLVLAVLGLREWSKSYRSQTTVTA